MKKRHIWTIPWKKWVINTKKKMDHKYKIRKRIRHMNKHSGSRSVKVKNKLKFLMHDEAYAVTDGY